jgi:hypothetical protein
LARARTKPPEEDPVTSGRLAGTLRLQPPQTLARVTRSLAATAPDPRENHASAPRPSWIEARQQ